MESEPSPVAGREKEIYKVTLVGSLVNLILVLVKFAAGVVGRSSAMIADAVHSLSDFATDIIVIIFVRISGKPKDENHKYGHGKFETLATLMVGVILLAVGLWLGYGAVVKISRVIHGDVLESPGMIAFWVALVSIAAKEILYRYTVVRGRKLNSDAVIANGWHHRSDAFSSIGTAVGIAGAIFLGERWTVLDPVAAVVVSLLIIYTALQLVKAPLDELMERAIGEETENKIIEIAYGFEGVSDLHNLHTRKIGNRYAIEFHIRMDGGLPLDYVHGHITGIERQLRAAFGPDTHIMIHVEPVKGAGH